MLERHLPLFRKQAIAVGLLLTILALTAPAAPTLRTVAVGARTFVPLRDLAAASGLRVTAADEERIILGNATHTLRFKTNSREMVFQGTTIWLNSPVIEARRVWSLESADALQVLDPLLRPQLYLRPYRAQVVLIDPGHGGKDVGAMSPSGLMEKDVTLDIARRLRVALVNSGFRVHMTRDNDRFVELSDRAAMISRVKADIFVSIHLNSAAGAARGVETYALPAAGFRSVHEGGGPAGGRPQAVNGHRHAAANAVLAHAIQRNVRQQTALPDRGVRFANYAVLKQATVPAALVECGFISHPADEALLRSAAHRERIATAIALGVQSYARTIASAQPRGNTAATPPAAVQSSPAPRSTSSPPAARSAPVLRPTPPSAPPTPPPVPTLPSPDSPANSAPPPATDSSAELPQFYL